LSLTTLIPFLGIVIAYLLGSIPTGYLLGRIILKTDIRQSGSGNTGATNVLRTFGIKAGLLVLLFDVLKGVLAILLARYISGHFSSGFGVQWLEAIYGLMVIAGHVFSVFLGFKGGKGVATTAGVFITLLPLSMLFCLVLFVYIVFSSKYVSLGSILAAFALLSIELVSQIIMHFPNLPRLLLVAVMVILIIVRHKANIKRMLAGNENKISFRTEQQI
jgi:acyl phosphate:glycerol-3-phosphate acyltransferase